MRRANSERARLTRLQKKEISLATMLFAVVVVFFVCNVPPLVVNILEVLKINVNALNNTSNLLVTFNSSVNLVIYCIFGDKFKRILFSFFFCPPMVKRRSGTSEFMTRYPLQPYRGEFKWFYPLMLGGTRYVQILTGDCQKPTLFSNPKKRYLAWFFDQTNPFDAKALPS